MQADSSEETNHPYTFGKRIVDAVFNFLTTVGFIAFAGGVSCLWAGWVP